MAGDVESGSGDGLIPDPELTAEDLRDVVGVDPRKLMAALRRARAKKSRVYGRKFLDKQGRPMGFGFGDTETMAERVGKRKLAWVCGANPLAGMTVAEVAYENAVRLARVRGVGYDPVTGQGSLEPRFEIRLAEGDGGVMWLPQSMADLDVVRVVVAHGGVDGVAEHLGVGAEDVYAELWDQRMNHDFEFWAVSTVMIQSKRSDGEEGKVLMPFRLRYAQRRLLRELERMRLAGVPIRLILVKARQWGGSTLTQVYMGWVQMRLRRRWHSTIVSQYEDQAKNIRGMYSTILRNYPEEFGKFQLKPYEGSTKNRLLTGRDAVLSIGSVENPDSLRSFDVMMAHLSEVGLWQTTAGKNPRDLVQSLVGSIDMVPLSLIVMESTAKGVGSFFHTAYLKAEAGESSYSTLFVPWYDIDLYLDEDEDFKERNPDIVRFVATMTEYEVKLWQAGATLNGISWYRRKIGDFDGDIWRMQSEYPSFASEAFQSTGTRVFPASLMPGLRQSVRKPLATGYLVGDEASGPRSLDNIRFVEDANGWLQVWAYPDTAYDVNGDAVTIRDRYAAFADVGGRTEKADKSVVKIGDRLPMADGLPMEVVAMIRYNRDQDLFAWDAVRLAKWYQDAMLAVEVNSLRDKAGAGDAVEPEAAYTVLDEIKPFYRNLYHRVQVDQHQQPINAKIGFHTNTLTKVMIINRLLAAIRDGEYMERDHITCDEIDIYEYKPDGRMGAPDGNNDDTVIATAGLVWLATKHMRPPAVISNAKHKPKRVAPGRGRTEASI